MLRMSGKCCSILSLAGCCEAWRTRSNDLQRLHTSYKSDFMQLSYCSYFWLSSYM